MIDRLAIATEGFRSLNATTHRSLAIATRGWILLAAATPSAQPIRVGGGGGALPLFYQPVAAQPEKQDYARRAKTVAAAMGVVMGDGDLADKIVASLGLILDEGDE